MYLTNNKKNEKTKTESDSVQGNTKILMQITAIFMSQDKFITFFTKWSLGNVNSRNLQQSRITSWFTVLNSPIIMMATCVFVQHLGWYRSGLNSSVQWLWSRMLTSTCRTSRGNCCRLAPTTPVLLSLQPSSRSTSRSRSVSPAIVRV